MAKVNKATINKKVASKTSKYSLWHWKTIVPVLVGGMMLLIANSAIWVNSVLFNTETFTKTATEAVLSEASRIAVAGGGGDRALVERPIAQRVVGEPATKFIARVLDSNLAEKALTRTVSRLQTAVTTANPQNIEIDLSGIKNVAATLIGAVESTGREVPEPRRELPDKIVLFDASNVPNLYSYGQIFLWLAPLAAMSGVL